MTKDKPEKNENHHRLRMLPKHPAVNKRHQEAVRSSNGEYRKDWEQEFTWLILTDGKMYFTTCQRAKMNNGFVRGCTTLQKTATRWLSLERAVKGMRANWACVVKELEEEAARQCPIAKGLLKQLLRYSFPALTHLLADVLAIVNRMNLTFQRENVDISSIKPIVEMTILSLGDLTNELSMRHATQKVKVP
ncbi:hypothetical protein WMY93_018082 [Mugilogobius chulae]|uniref:Uncharacterized protein n=1 Tax=Mugilogobius chulae TaxID=88201 RepID=A0AAW0NKK4_9GOBI